MMIYVGEGEGGEEDLEHVMYFCPYKFNTKQNTKMRDNLSCF